MTNKRPEPGTKEFEEWIRHRAQKRSRDLFQDHDTHDFDERGPLLGDKKSVTSTDAEAFPDEKEEYRPKDKAPKLIK